jgi:branched-chain amino acid transport system substrate-binding protein
VHRRLFTLLVVIAMTTTVAPIAAAHSLPPRSDVLTLAFEGPLTGGQAANGRDMLRGTKLAIAEINKAGGVLGLPIKLITGNDKATPSIGVTVAENLVKQQPFGLIGPYNSSVGLANLPIFIAGGVFPVQLTSTDDTKNMGITVQPKNSQISPVELQWMTTEKVGKVSILYDPDTYTKGMADRMFKGLKKTGVLVTKIRIDSKSKDFTAQVAQAVTNNPDVVYVSTYYPQGAIIAKNLLAAQADHPTKCFMGLANQDAAFVKQAGIPAASACTFSGVPTPNQFGNAKSTAYVKNYAKKFSANPGPWGIFTYDSVYTLVNAIRRAGRLSVSAVSNKAFHTTNLSGATGRITIDPKTGYRSNVPVAILNVDGTTGKFVLSKLFTK